ncbi:hypothetical protein N7461_005580 [Penicillium sp. DV-2018c]|nr:hypothetical protein N7461_005580 [Penicillium sp. DV-2018c]
MASNSPPDHKALFEQERETQKRAEAQASEARRLVKARQKQVDDQRRETTFVEFLYLCHDVLSQRLRVSGASGSTTRTISLPKGKYCPTRLEQWVDCEAQQQDIYNSVRRHLQPEENPPRLFLTS